MILRVIVASDLIRYLILNGFWVKNFVFLQNVAKNGPDSTDTARMSPMLIVSSRFDPHQQLPELSQNNLHLILINSI